jgi:hypothetical protein
VKKKNKMTMCIGSDVHKKKCVATLKRDSQIVEQTSFYNNGHGIKEFTEHIKLYGETATAVCESTGNYWIRLHDTLGDSGIDTVLANPIKTKIIAQAKLKDDKIDSNVLADLLRADLVYRSFVPNVSNHLSCLLDCGLVQNRREGKNIFYSLRNKKVSKILEESDAILSEVARGIYECVNYNEEARGR